jgi:L-alanine-DL-glutamate epimerase-like enolase superfamily enzyme
MRGIAAIEGFVARTEGAEVEEVFIVCVSDEEGRTGIGESVAAPRALKALLGMPRINDWSQGIERILVGADPLEAKALWDRLYDATFYHGRRGITVHALSALDMALHDLAGKQLVQPVYKLLGGARCNRIRPYATIFPGWPEERSIDDLLEEIGRQVEAARQLGFDALKLEVLFGDLASDSDLVKIIQRTRQLAGDACLFAVDFGYRWRDWQDARWVLSRVADCDLFFAEAALRHDDLHGHAKLSQHCPMRIAGGELAATRWEIRDWLEIGKVSVVQPSIARAGGFTELCRITDLCDLYGVVVIPHSWATGITDISNIHLQAASSNIPLIEYRSPHLLPSMLRRDLVRAGDPPLVGGRFALPHAPGLGIDLDREALSRHLLQ